MIEYELTIRAPQLDESSNVATDVTVAVFVKADAALKLDGLLRLWNLVSAKRVA